MLSIFDFQGLVADGFFGGNLSIAGILIYAAVLLAVFALTRNTSQTLIVSIPVTLAFSVIGILSIDLTVLLLIVSVLALAFGATKVWRST